MRRNKDANVGNAVLILVAMVLGVLIGVMFSANRGLFGSSSGTLQEKVGEVMQLVENQYVDDVDADSLGERVVASILRELDPHSTYLSAKATERNDEIMRGNFEGVGIVLHYEDDSVYVGQIIPDGPAQKTDLLPGDLILRVGTDSVSGVGMPTDSVISRLRGPRGTIAHVEALRLVNGKPTPVNVNIRRGVVDYTTVVCSTMLDDTTGYIMLSSFSSTSHDEFVNALYSLKKNGMRRLIFDLRGNGGGSLSSAVGIAAELLPAHSLIVYTQGAHSRRNDIRAPRKGLFSTGAVTVIVDENSASASEVVSGALQDNDRALIVGRRTFGKGLVQGEYGLKDGSSVLLTTARYYTPSGRSIQRPYDAGTDAYYRSYLEQLANESYADSITVHISDSTPYLTVGGRTVYGGGGIVPDVLIPYRKDASFVYYNALTSKGLLNRVAFRHVRQHASSLLKTYPSVEAFNREFHTDNRLLEQLFAEGEKKGIARDEKSISVQRTLISTMLKAYIGLALYGNDAFYDAFLKIDDDLQKAINIKS